MALERSPYLDPIPQDAMAAANKFIDNNPDIVQLLAELDTAAAMTVGELRNTIIDNVLERARPFFEELRIGRNDRQNALTSALVSRWAELHRSKPGSRESSPRTVPHDTS